MLIGAPGSGTILICFDLRQIPECHDSATLKAYAKMLDLQAPVWLCRPGAVWSVWFPAVQVQQRFSAEGVDDPKSRRIMRTLLVGAHTPTRSLKISLIK
jgi:hypothetical protein